jgi:2-amino-4-hydroxy-6-hydroxymethyldihydropteridine diphosphokinase
MFKYIVAVGSNIDAHHHVQQAWLLTKKYLDEHTQIAPLLTTKAQGDCSQPDYINTAFCFKSNLDLSELKQQLLDIEQQLKRVRSANKNAARTIDLDICCCDSEIIDDDYYHYDFVKKSADYFLETSQS